MSNASAPSAAGSRTSPRRRRGELTRERIVVAALGVVDRDGLDGLTMRRLAEALNVDPMAIYRHVEGKEGLLDGVAEALWEEVYLPGDGVGWKAALREFASSLRQVAHAHPTAYALLLRGCPFLPVPALRALDGALIALAAAGLDRPAAAEAVRLLVSYAAGYAMLEIAAPAAVDSGVEQIVRLTRGLPKEAPIELVEVARLMGECDCNRQFLVGVDLILDAVIGRTD